MLNKPLLENISPLCYMTSHKSFEKNDFAMIPSDLIHLPLQLTYKSCLERSQISLIYNKMLL